METTESKVFSELESLKIEVTVLQSQLLKEEERIVSYQQKIVDLTKENLQLRNELLKAQNSKLFDELGIKGKVKLQKQDDSRYKVEPDNGQAKYWLIASYYLRMLQALARATYKVYPQAIFYSLADLNSLHLK